MEVKGKIEIQQPTTREFTLRAPYKKGDTDESCIRIFIDDTSYDLDEEEGRMDFIDGYLRTKECC